MPDPSSTPPAPVLPYNGPAIRLESVVKTYDLGEVQVNALRGVSLEINRGEFVAVTGASGSG